MLDEMDRFFEYDQIKDAGINSLEISRLGSCY